jgi:hypothetical protein
MLLIFSVSCEGGKMSGKKDSAKLNNNISEKMLEKIAEKKIYFGHQSVGFNILDGVNDILKETPNIKLNMVKTSDPALLKTPIFAHSPIGLNDEPESKTQDFVNKMKNGLGNNTDIAFFKFCYVDITSRTDIDKVFSDYKKNIEELKKEYPATRFVHVTAPLSVSKPTIKTFIKKLMGRQDNNIKRNLFNERLRKEYDGIDPVFDLANVESTYPDGSKASFTNGGKTYYSLVPEYTDDGGHLNKTGRKVAAAELLKFLSDVK